MSATDELRKLLDERGAKTYHEQNYITWRDANDYQCFAFETYERPGLLRVHCNLTPEQAIAATLGSEQPPVDKLIRCLENDYGITASWDGLRKFWCIELTEEGVRMRDEAATLGSDTKPCYATDYTHDRCKYSVNRGWTEDTKFYVPTATSGRGTCKNKAPRYLDFLCSECGFVHYIDDANCTGDGNDWNYCPECGRKVE